VAGAAAVIVLRHKRPDLPRPYRTWGYPVVPAVFALGSLGIAVNALFDHPAQCAWSLVAAGAGLVVYLFWRGKVLPRAE
jgi:APA family basic amino acid/polyamine antiporter